MNISFFSHFSPDNQDVENNNGHHLSDADEGPKFVEFRKVLRKTNLDVTKTIRKKKDGDEPKFVDYRSVLKKRVANEEEDHGTKRHLGANQ